MCAAPGRTCSTPAAVDVSAADCLLTSAAEAEPGAISAAADGDSGAAGGGGVVGAAVGAASGAAAAAAPLAGGLAVAAALARSTRQPAGQRQPRCCRGGALAGSCMMRARNAVTLVGQGGAEWAAANRVDLRSAL